MSKNLIYGIEDRPPWLETMALGFQHYLTMFGSTVAIPLLLAPQLGMQDDPVAVGWLISTMFFVSGITTLLQSTWGNRLPATDYARATIYSTLSPCDMCSGAILLYGIRRVIVGENHTFQGPEDYVRSRGVQVEVVDDPECRRLMDEFIRERPELWNEDIGEPS